MQNCWSVKILIKCKCKKKKNDLCEFFSIVRKLFEQGYTKFSDLKIKNQNFIG